MQFSYKIVIICRVLIIANIPLYTTAFAQIQPVKKLKIYREQVTADSMQKMIEIKTMVPNIIYDLRYATENNFTHQKLYESGKRTFLRLPVVRALQEVQEDLAKRNYGLKLFDAYRPYTVTQKMWDLIHDEKYVADPSKGSGHNRGLAVDLTIIDLKDGSELNMGIDFDNFTDTAHHTFKNLPADILQNRMLLKETMEKHGFKALETEWWHYNWPNNRNYEVLDIDFRKLAFTQ
ncbi:MAG TPA: M15 family metallopeptidase [Flavisolibacter sp.]|nr:M15 family metallopeptidase [Flavisolibacter sp.]